MHADLTDTSLARPRWARLPRDPRILQIAFLSSFFVFGALERGFPAWQAPLLVAACCGTQWLCTRLLGLPSVGYLSPLITSLGLSILLRSDLVWVPILAGCVGIAGKFLVRFRGKHLFNPAALGLGAAMLLTPHAWCSPSQWGHGLMVAAWVAALGCAVASRAFRADISLAFLGFWTLLKAGRVLLLGQRWAVLAHQLETGSLLLFAFFMISDPKTTPERRGGRIALAAAVALLGFHLQHGLFVQNALVWSLLSLSPLTALFDAALPKETPCAPSSPALSA